MRVTACRLVLGALQVASRSARQAGRICPMVVTVVALAGCEVNLNTEGLTERDTRTFDVSGRPVVVLDTFDGSIEIHSWDRKQVEVEVEKRGMEQSLIDEMKIKAEQHGDRIVLKVTGPSRREFRGVTVGVHISPQARLRVALPRESDIEATSGDGSIAIEDVAGRVILTTADGSVRAARVSGDLRVRSGDGSIRMEGIVGAIDLETNDGSIGLDATPTALRARTGDGSIRLQVEPESAMASDWEVRTGDGSVVLTLPSGFSAELDAESADGTVRASHPALKDGGERSGEREERRRSLRTTMGSGGRILRVRTGDGTIRIQS
ncbi:MAG: DUF4097 domain-containing protein [Vicinamibacterales bacterium]